jgi:antitoxin HigA-1
MTSINKFVYIYKMKSFLQKYKGIHPGVVLERELTKRGLPQRPFALSVGSYPQTLNAITQGKRKLNIALALKIEEKLELEEGSLAVLQTYFDIEEEKQKRFCDIPNIEVIRKVIFWDTDFAMIDWQRNHKAVIRRIFERGNKIEKKEIIRFYGKTTVNAALNSSDVKPYTVYKNLKHRAVL